jgi:2-C-methyl-D-erythritol 2,4-cyclodiphosphate synthase
MSSDNPVNVRVGHGFDVHRLAEGRRLMLGGVEIPFAKGLLGHSDADVLLHAVADALLGAAGLGDIGKHFPPADARYKNADSAVLLSQVAEMVRQAGYPHICNVDCIVMAERPALAPHIELMCLRIADVLKMEPAAVSVKATTCEGLGFVGREEGIAASAVCLIRSHE